MIMKVSENFWLTMTPCDIFITKEQCVGNNKNFYVYQVCAANGDSKDVVLKVFADEVDAQSFADKLVALLNMEDNQ